MAKLTLATMLALTNMATSALELTDGIITLSPLELTDAELVVDWDTDLEIQRWFDWPLTPDANDPTTHAARLRGAERTIRDKWRRWELGEEFMFAIRDLRLGTGLGSLDLQPRGDGRGNVAYAVLARHRGRGATTRAVKLAAQYAFHELHWTQLEIRADAENLASCRVAEKAGFTLQGIARDHGVMQRHEPLRGQSFDEAVYYLLRS